MQKHGPLPDSSFTFDFDAWAKLAKSDPEEFERQRLQAEESVIAGMSRHKSQHLAECTRWRINLERQRAKTPLQLCINLSTLMWECYTRLNDALQGRIGEEKDVSHEVIQLSHAQPHLPRAEDNHPHSDADDKN